ncbi:MAG: response regulator [Desulfobulbaceae bacterium]|nr:MAG: response regulator [Desulfobulbaceae bacterium]
MTEKKLFQNAREKFLGLSLESTRKSYYPQLIEQLEAVKQDRKMLELLIDRLPARVSYVDRNQQYLVVNHYYETLTGTPKEAIIGKTIREVIGPDNYRYLEPEIRRVLQGETVHFEAPFVTPTEEEQLFETSLVPISDNKGRVLQFIILAIDVTERNKQAEEKKKLEDSLFEAQKFKAIGTLAAGIAHDFNNLLMGVLGHVSLLELAIDKDSSQHEHFEAIERHIQTATGLTRQLLGFARGGKYQVKSHDLNQLLLESSQLFGRTHKEIRIHHRLAKETIIADIDRTQLEQVLLNIYLNAYQAMPEGGQLFLESSIALVSETFADAHHITSGTYGKLSITDTGVGMSRDTAAQVFDPFFTTKEKQRGTGLGLASAYGIIKSHHGLITVYSELGKGSTFSVYLPLSESQVMSEKPVDREFLPGEGTVLLVDDEVMILDVGEAMLQSIGYQVITANSGSEALDLVRQLRDTIDLIILDLVMPGLSGSKTFEKLREIEPTIPIILSSGYSMNGDVNELMRKGCNGFIQKPFNLAALSAAIRAVQD